MVNFSYDDTVPTTGANPSNQYGLMSTNFASIKGILAVDHVTLSTNDGGQHLQVSYNGNHTPLAPTGVNSVLYTSFGVASTSSLLNFVNPNGTFPISLIRAFGYYPGNTGAGVLASIGNQTFNVASVTKISTGDCRVVLVANAVTGSNFLVLVSSTRTTTNSSVCSSYNINGIGDFELIFLIPGTNNVVNVSSFTFIVLQI